MGPRHSLRTWAGECLHAAYTAVGACRDINGLVGIDFVTRDGKVFAHGHFDVETALKFRADLDRAISEAKQKSLN